MLRLIRVPFEDGRIGVLASFAFNLGAGALQLSTLRRKVNPRGARRGAGRVPALGLGRRTPAQGAGLLVRRCEAGPYAGSAP